MLLPETFVKHHGTKIYKYSEPLPLESIRNTLTTIEYLQREERDLDLRGGAKKILKSPIRVNLIPDVGIFGNITFHKQEYDANDEEHYIKKIPFDFLICQDPSVLIIHGSRTLMYKITEGLEKALYPDENWDDRNNPPDPYFHPYAGTDPATLKYIIKKITKAIEAQNPRNILFDPHFKQLGSNRDVRGGECFWRRDGVSATRDERFCYLFELCTFWEPELKIYTCSGILSPSNNTPIVITINSDLSFSFSHGVQKDLLDTFWVSLILPILRADDYRVEQTECVENARIYSARITPHQ